MFYMLIDITKVEETKILKIAKNREVIAWSKLYKAEGRKVIGPAIEGKGFSKLDQLALQYLCWNTFEATPEEEYNNLVEQCKELVKGLFVDNTPLKELEHRVSQIVPPEVPEGEKKPRKQRATTPKDPNGRPKMGSTTGAVWDIADELTAKHGRPATRQEVIAQCVEEGVNKATASTQFSKWKKSQGGSN